MGKHPDLACPETRVTRLEPRKLTRIRLPGRLQFRDACHARPCGWTEDLRIDGRADEEFVTQAIKLPKEAGAIDFLEEPDDRRSVQE
ncbi:MAG TPA: hypothetical protein VJ547_02740 [Candidatus Thermoplasmatota archaeon]|nr:hypothetical protein [Candidatus Thermoplasmatota archaeon]